MEEALVDKSPIPLKDYQGLHVEIDEEKKNLSEYTCPSGCFLHNF